MGLLLHQFRKDLRQTWIVWLLWLLFTGLQFALAAWNVGASDLAGQGAYAQLLGLVPTVHNLLLFVLVPLLLLQEPTVGTTAFWLTKPMPRGIVLGSKLLALLILVAVPLLGKCAVFASHGLTPGDVALAGLQVGLHELSWIALITALAALSPSFGWYIVAAVAFLALQYLSGWANTWLAMLAERKARSSPGPAWSLLQSRAVVAALIQIGVGLGVAAFQYLRRRTRLSVAVAAAGYLLMLAAGQWWPGDFLRGPKTPPSAPAFDVSRVTVDPRRYHNVYDMPDWRGGAPLKTMNMGVAVNGVAASRQISILNEGGELVLPDGRKLPLPGNDHTYSGGSMTVGAADAAIGDLPILAENPYGGSNQSISCALYAVDAAIYAKNASATGEATFRLKLHAESFRIANEIPLVPGASFGKGSDRTTLASVLRDSDGVTVSVRRRTVRLQLKPSGGNLLDFPRLVLVNRKRGEAILAQGTDGYAGMSPFARNAFMAGVTGVLGGGDDRIESVNDSGFYFGPPRNYPLVRALPVPLDEAWLADATLVFLEPVFEGEFPATLRIPNFSLDGKNLPADDREGRSLTPDRAALAAVVLPENPTRADVWRYINQIIEISQRQQSLSQEDPQIGMLRRVGPAHAAELFIAIASQGYNYHLTEALKGMDLSGRPELRGMAVRLLVQKPELIEIVTKYHWEKDAEPVLLARIRDSKARNEYMIEQWIQALASLRDPATYDALIACIEARAGDFRNNPYLDYIRPLPGPLVAAMVERLWKKARETKDEKLFLGAAASWGIADALDRAAEIVALPADGADKEKTEQRNAARNALRNATACPDRLLDGDLAAWYAANKAQLGFDPGLGRFLPHPLALPPDAGWPTPAEGMKALGLRAAKGDTEAVDAIDGALARVVEGLDPQRDEKRIAALRNIAWSAFGVLRDAAADDDGIHPEVLRVLDGAQGKEHLHGFVAWGYGKAAAAGSDAALDALVHYKDRGWTLPDALTSLLDAVRKNNPRAVDFVLAAYADPATAALADAKGVRTKLVSMIQDAANAGSEKAKAVYETIQK